MKTYFYSQIISINSLNEALDNLSLEQEEKEHLLLLAQSNIHHAVIDAVLSELKPADKVLFLKHVAAEEDAKVWELLNTKVEKIEDKIKKAAESISQELHADIKNAK